MPTINCRDVKKAAMDMSSKAAGPDGWEARWIAELPQPALIRLAQLYALCETKGVWPSSMIHWRIVFLPKSKPNQWPSPLEMRPICIGSVLYRMWTRIRLTHLRNFLTQFLVPYQSGGIGGPSVQDLLISWHQEFGDYDYCLALDYQKAFDSMDYILPIHVMEQVGVPMQICNLIGYQWDNHKRWCSFNGTVHPQPLVNSKGIPQGDGWSPIALSLVLSVVQRYQTRHVPCAKTLLYIDDRTILARNMQDLTNALHLWQRLEDVTRMRTNARKTQPIARSGDAYESLKQQGWEALRVGTVLGVSLGMFPRSPTLNETKRADGLATIARRIGVLPVTRKFRALLASLVLTSKASWGWVLNGLSPSNVMLDRAYKVAVHHPYTHLHSSTDLRKFFLWGHRSDLQFVVAQNLLVALTKWRSKHHNVPWNDNTPLIKSLRTTLSKLLCRFDNSGRITWSLGSWDTSCPPLWCTRLAHNLRTHWRILRLENWLKCSRNDAQVAQQSGLVVTSSLVESIHQSSQHVTGHESAVLSGGLRTAAHAARKTYPLRAVSQ